jgi:hypothetical protein
MLSNVPASGALDLNTDSLVISISKANKLANLKTSSSLTNDDGTLLGNAEANFPILEDNVDSCALTMATCDNYDTLTCENG